MNPPLKSDPLAELVTLTDAAEHLGVHYMTAYRYVRTGRMTAEKRAGKWWVAPHDLAAVIEEGTGARRRATGEQVPREFLIEPLTARLIAGDTAGCWDLISAALSGGAVPAEIHTKLLQRALENIGERWHNGELTIADEHRATATSYRLLGQLGPLFRHPGRRRGSIVLGSASGDFHSLPTAIMSDLLSDKRFDVIDLGGNTPTASFIGVADSVDSLVGIGLCVAVDDCLDVALSQIAELRASQPNTFLLAGGPAIMRSGRASEFAVYADAVSRSAEDVCLAFDGECAKGSRSA